MLARIAVRSAAVVFLLALAPLVRAQEPKTVRILANWFAQADQAGFWQAQKDGLGKEAGIRIQVLQGGPKIQTIPQVAAGQAEFGIGNADDVLLARSKGAPVRAVFAQLDYVPYTLVYHADLAVKSIGDLSGRTFAVSIGNAYWEWVKKNAKLTNTREIPVTGDLSLFRNDPKMVQQGYSPFLPARMAQAGIAVQQVKVASLGYRPYDVLFTTDDMIKNHPDVVKATIAAVQQGWRNFVRDPLATQPMILELNKQMTPEVNAAATKEIITELLSHDLGKIGCMTDARWAELTSQLKSVGFVPASFNDRQGYDRSFVPGC